MQSKETRNWKKKWRRWRLKPIQRYYFELKENPTHPFEDLGEGIFYLLIRSDKFVFGLAVIFIAITCFTAFSVEIGVFSFPMAVFLIVLAYGVFCLYGHFSSKELIVSRHGGYLLRIKGNGKTLHEEPINNIYIKLQRKYDTNQLPHYFLILGGYNLDDIRMTGFSPHAKGLRFLGMGVANRVGLNYFDVEERSPLHKIIHHPGRPYMRPPDAEIAKFLYLHGITENFVREARQLEGIPEDSDIVPVRVARYVYGNYGLLPSKILAKRAEPLYKRPEDRSPPEVGNETLKAMLVMADERDSKFTIEGKRMEEKRFDNKDTNKVQ